MYNKFNKAIKYLTAVMFVALIVLCADAVTVFAAANIEISADNAAADQEVKVKVTVNSDQNIGTFDLRITYDTTLLDYVGGADNGGSGVLQVLNSDLTQSNTVTKELTFKALGEGTATVNVQTASSNVLDMNANPMEITGGTGNITIGNSQGGSADNSLSSISVSAVKKDGSNVEVQLTPAFSKDVTEYSLNVGNDTKKLSVAVTSSDASATTKITGTKLQKGDNMTVISVTASNGEVKEYKIYTKKGDDSSSEQQNESAVKGNIEALPLPDDLSTKKDGKTGKFIVQNFDGISPPEGFTAQGYKYGDNQVAVACNGSVVAFMLADDETGANAAWFVYNKDKDTFSLFNELKIGDKSYILLTADNSVNIPEGFSESTIKINDIDATVWSDSNDQGIVIIYASCNNAQPGLYYYDNRENSAIRYFAASSAGKDSSDNYKSKYLKEKNDSSDMNIVIIEIVVGFSVICIILGIMCVIFARKAKKPDISDEDDQEKDEPEEDETQNEEKELKLDMAMQANEVKTETLANDVNSILDGDDQLIDTMNMVPEETSVKTSVIDTNEENNTLSGESEVDAKVSSDEKTGENEEEDNIDIVFVDLEEDSKE